MSEKRKCKALKGTATKKARKAITLEMKLQILSQHQSGMKVNKLASKFKLSHSTVSTILKDKERYLKELNNAMPMQSTMIRKRNGLIPEMEKLLIAWINDQLQQNHILPSQPTISAKALSLFEMLKNSRGETSKDEVFGASKGWFDRFRKRAGLRNIRVHGEAASLDTETAKEFPEKLAEIIEEEGYCSRQVFNVNETGLFWKRMPSRCHIAKEEKSKDRLTLLLGANAAGDCKLKPLVIYRAENPRALKSLVKGALPVIWKFNSKAGMTATIFEDWFSHHFVPEVEKYCTDNNLPFKAMLILDNSQSHSPILQYYHPNIKITFIPPNVTALLQPMDQGVITSFRAYYLQQTFERLIEAINKEGGPTLNEFWKSFNVLDAVKIVKDAWNTVTESSLNEGWMKLVPEFVRNFEATLPHPVTKLIDIVTNVIDIANRLDLEVSFEDVVEFLESHSRELNEDFIEMKELGNNEEEQVVAMEPEEEEEQVVAMEPEEKIEVAIETAPPPAITVQRLSEAFEHIEFAMKIFKTDDPNFERSSKVLGAMTEAYACYREIYHEKKMSSGETSQPVQPTQKRCKKATVSTESSQSSPTATAILQD